MLVDDDFYDHLEKDLTFSQVFLNSLWSFFICSHKVCKFLQTLIRSWLKDSLKQFKCQRLVKLEPTWKITPIFCLEILEPCIPKCPHRHKLVCDNLGHLLPLLTNVFVIEHNLLTKLPMNLLMMQHLCWINWDWHDVVNNIMKCEHALEIMKYHNVFYCHTIATQRCSRCSFKESLQFEIVCLKFCFLDGLNIWQDFCKSINVHKMQGSIY
jgi:hypothetical protein